MQGPVADILLLLLLILFFGFQQRARPQLYFRFWFAGWLMVLGSFIVWGAAGTGDPSLLIQKAIRFDLLLVAGMAFVMSFLATRESLPRMVALSMLILVPACAAVDLQILHPLSQGATQIVILLLALVAHSASIAMTHLGLPRAWKLRRRFFLPLSALMGLFMIFQIARIPDWQVLTPVLFEMFFFAAIYYATIYGMRSLAGVLGTVGFTAWAIFYPLSDHLTQHPVALRTLYQFWNLPKYFVGFSMIIRVFEESTAEKDRLAEQFHSLYEDFRILYQNHPHPMWVLTADEGQFIAANDIAAATYGYTDADAKTLRLEEIEVPFDEETERLAGLVPLPPGSRRCRLRCKNGDVLWVNIYDRPISFQGAPARLIMARDVSDFMEFNSAMAHRMLHDELTGLPNRRLLTDRLQLAIASNLRHESYLAVMAIDVDHFKSVNDTYGHVVGDECLKLVAKRLRDRIRKSDTVARVGGEEFIALISALHSEDDANKVAMELLRAFDTPLELPGLRLPLTVSIGIALCPNHGLDPESLHRLADEALYRAKHDGRNCIRFARPGSGLARPDDPLARPAA